MAKETKSRAPVKTGEIEKAAPARVSGPFEETERLFDQFFGRRWLAPWRLDLPRFADFEVPELRMPKVDVIDRENEVVVKAEVPGVDKKDLDVSVAEDSVTIKGTTSHEEKEEKGDYYRCEMRRGAFARTVALPSAVDGDKAKASFKDGVLELVLPKAEGAKRKRIAID
jgi:HSP20 family protein